MSNVSENRWVHYRPVVKSNIFAIVQYHRLRVIPLGFNINHHLISLELVCQGTLSTIPNFLPFSYLFLPFPTLFLPGGDFFSPPRAIGDFSYPNKKSPRK